MALIPKHPAWGRLLGDIVSSETKTVFQRVLSDVKAVKVVLTLSNDAQDKAKQLEINIFNSDGEVSDMIGPKGGAAFSLLVEAIEDGPNLKLNVTNNEAYDLKYNLIFSDS